MRYAEVEHEEHGSMLRRLGSCRFDFDIVDCLASGNLDDVSTLGDAVAEIFSGTPAHLLSVALDPRLCYSFKTSVAGDANESTMTSQVLKELALVADNETPLFVRTETAGMRTLKDGRTLSHISVLALPESIRDRLKGFADRLGVGLVVTSSVNASSAMIGFLEDALRSAATSFSVLVGDQGTHAEMAVCVRGRRLSSALVIPESSEDAIYALWAFLRREGLSPADMDTIYIYGENERDSAFHAVPRQCGATLRQLSPLDVVRLQAGSGGERELSPYVPCVGAAIETSV